MINRRFNKKRAVWRLPCALLLGLLCWPVTVWAETLTLRQCVDTVLHKNPRILAAQANREESQAELAAVRKDLFPALRLDYLYKRQPSDSRAETFPALENYYNYALTLEQPLFRGGALVTNVKINELGLQRSGATHDKTSNDLVLSTHTAYFTLLKNQKLEQEAAQAVSRLEKHLKDAKNFYQAGLIPKNDLLTSELELAQGRQDLLRARHGTKLAAAALNILLQQPVARELQVADEFTYTPREAPWENLVEQALATRPELWQTELDVNRAEQEITLAQADYFPAITLSATYEKQGDKPWIDSYPYGASEIKSAQVVASWKLWAWGQSRDRVTAAQRRLTATREEAASTRDAVSLQLREAYLRVEETAEHIGVTGKAIEQAEENYRINESRYQAQLASSTEVLDAQTLLIKAKTNYYNALYDHNIAIAGLEWATGVLAKQYGRSGNETSLH